MIVGWGGGDSHGIGFLLKGRTGFRGLADQAVLGSWLCTDLALAVWPFAEWPSLSTTLPFKGIRHSFLKKGFPQMKNSYIEASGI